ncbi:MAG: hypothetical protein J6M42_03090, partial [Clostridia bacterium]|nr:hypothetical protein [Clostridia bacterium]
MKHPRKLTTRAAALLLALLLLGTAGLTACDKGNDPSDTDPADATTQAPESGGDLTLPDGTTPADPEAPTDPAETDKPSTPEAPDSLIGDGSPLAEVYPTFSEVGGLYTARAKTVEITADKGEGMTIRAACFDADGKLTGQVITHTYISAKAEAGLHYTVML